MAQASMSAAAPIAAPATKPPVMPVRRALIVDEKNMLRLWLEEKVARRELTPVQADDMLQSQEAQGKLWTGPMKDGLGSAKLFFKIAKDFGSWKGAKVYFSKSKAGHDLVTFKGWPAGRKIITGTRYRLDNPKIVEMQIGRPGLRAAARESARFGVWLVVAVDVADYLLRDNSSLGQLLGSLTVDLPSVVLASAIGAAAGSFVSGTTIAGLAAIGTLACGPFLVALGVGLAAGVGLYLLDRQFELTDKLSRAYDDGLAKLATVWHELGTEADVRFNQLAHSAIVHDMRQDAHVLAEKLARRADLVRSELVHLW